MAAPHIPVTREEEYLAAILSELEAIRKALVKRGRPQAPRPDYGEADEIELRERRRKDVVHV